MFDKLVLVVGSWSQFLPTWVAPQVLEHPYDTATVFPQSGHLSTHPPPYTHSTMTQIRKPRQGKVTVFSNTYLIGCLGQLREIK